MKAPVRADGGERHEAGVSSALRPGGGIVLGWMGELPVRDALHQVEDFLWP